MSASNLRIFKSDHKHQINQAEWNRNECAYKPVCFVSIASDKMNEG